MAIKAIVTDVEGTTTPISFVKDQLFPYAKAHLPAFVRANAAREDVAALLHDARELEGNQGLDLDGTIALLARWIDEDRKATPLKTLQGLIWADGFRKGELKGHVYEDAVSQLKAWKEAGLSLHVYSSGSVAAQKLVFGHTKAGDLTPLFSGYFDTTIGGKLEAKSYVRIARELKLEPSQILFLSDHTGELDAAREAGLATICLDRGEAIIPHDQTHYKVSDFTAIHPSA